ncbi:MAG: hypothetical protein ISP86_03205 [Shewanellaceae bacterium]|nr:hypothetical protein [Shewanellaceae bacterium]
MKHPLFVLSIRYTLSWLLASSATAAFANADISPTTAATNARVQIPVPHFFECDPEKGGYTELVLPNSADAEKWTLVLTKYVEQANNGSCRAFQALAEIYTDHVDARSGQVVTTATNRHPQAAIPYFEVGALVGRPAAEYALGQLYLDERCTSDQALTVAHGLLCLKRLKRAQNYLQRSLAHTDIPQGLEAFSEPKAAWLVQRDMPEGLSLFEQRKRFQENPPAWFNEAWFDEELSPRGFDETAMATYFATRMLIKYTEGRIHDISVALTTLSTDADSTTYVAYQPKRWERDDKPQFGPHLGTIRSKSATEARSIYNMHWIKQAAENAAADDIGTPHRWDVVLYDVFPTSATCDTEVDERKFVRNKIKLFKRVIKSPDLVTQHPDFTGLDFQGKRSKLVANLKKLANRGSCKAFFWLGKLHADVPNRDTNGQPLPADYVKALNFMRVAAQASIPMAEYLMSHFIIENLDPAAPQSEQKMAQKRAHLWAQRASDCQSRESCGMLLYRTEEMFKKWAEYRESAYRKNIRNGS